MHGYTGNCGLGCAGTRRRGMGDQVGSGEVAVEGTALPTDGMVTALDTTTLIPYGYTSLPGTGTIGSGAGSSVNWNSLISQLGSIGTRLGSMALLPSGSSLLPSGAVISPSGAATGLLTSGSVGGISLTSILLIGGLGLAVFAIVNAMGKR